ncbi:hypothetical protein I6N96_11475 [Enterococcus sp. BWM-S5]|uniref:Uncharacterized protein n=1 Tax=Enterococcus larvae TaxID=2794352 RepID=A0ABS4CJV7_9ENTE|nr:hypothetical protein [Enterococcus larvae]MBP1046889.1 hypothetical protein [Enterococcus larvae]
MKQIFSSSDLFKSVIQRKVSAARKEQTQTIWHWSLLILFSMLTYAGITQQLLLIVLLIGITAIVRGPLMLLWGSIYSAMIAFFPPIALLLSLIFFVLNLDAAVKNWRVTLAGIFFYTYPFIGRLLLSHSTIDPKWLTLILLSVGITLFHFILKRLYGQGFISRPLAWAIVSMPHTLFILFLPKKIRGLRRNKPPYQ